MLIFSHAFFPKLLSGRHRHDPDACQQCDLLGPRCEEVQRFWKPMMEILALVRHPDASFFTLAMEVRAVHWTTFNTAANRYLQHLCASVPSPHDASIPPALGPQRYCPSCREQTIWLFFWDYGSGTYAHACGSCAFRQACERAALVWKLEQGHTTQNAWMFRRLRQWITEDVCDAFHLSISSNNGTWASMLRPNPRGSTAVRRRVSWLPTCVIPIIHGRKEDGMPQHERPDMSRPATEQEAFWINEWLHLDPHWFVPGQLPLSQQEAHWLVAYISRVHTMFHPTMIQVEPGEQPERRYQVALSYFSHNPAQPLMQVIVQSLEDYTNVLRWASGRDSCFERETEALPPEQQAAEEQRVFTFRRMIYAHLGLFSPEQDKDGEPA